MGDYIIEMARIQFTVSSLALLLCYQAATVRAEDMDTQQFIDHLAREAGAAYTTAAEAATQALKDEQAKQPSKEELVEKCICEQRANSGDPCTDSGLDNSQEKKLRADIDASCAQELAPHRICWPRIQGP